MLYVFKLKKYKEQQHLEL